MKTINESFAKRKAAGYFNDMFCTPSVKLSNLGGEEINPGDHVQITGRGSSKNEFNIRKLFTDIHIHNVWCEHLQLYDKMIIELEDNGQDFTELHVNQDGVVIDAKPFQSSVWQGARIPRVMYMLEPGNFCPMHHPPAINFGHLKHKIENIKFI